MNETLLQAENEALKARIKFLELKLSLHEPKKEQFVVYDKLSRPQLRDISNIDKISTRTQIRY